MACAQKRRDVAHRWEPCSPGPRLRDIIVTMVRKRSPGPRHSRNKDSKEVEGFAASVSFPSVTPRMAAALALICCITAIAYWPAIQGALLWDDDNHVTRPDLQSLHGLWRIWSDLDATQQYYPLLHSAFWVEHRIWGDAALGYHLTNIGLHSLSALLVVLIVGRLRLPGAWLAGLLFALHPVCVESVAWITEQKNTLSGVFYLASAFTYLGFDQTRRRPQYFLALGFFLLALASKTATVTLPAALLVLLWWLRGQLAWRRDVAPLLPWVGLGVSSGLITAYVEKVYLGAQGKAFALSLPECLLLAGRAPWFYACKVLWPVNLIFSYPHWKIDPAALWQYLFPVGLAIVVAGFGLLARRNRGPLAAFLIFAGTLFPVLGFLNVFYFRYSYVADHFQYLACLGIVVPAAVGLAAAAQRWELGTRWRIGLSALLLVFLAGLTWGRSTVYTDAETLYRDTLARNPDSWLARNNLGLLLAQEPGRLPEAISQYRQAVRIQPEYPEAHFNLGSALAHSDLSDRLPEAIAEYQTALRLKPDYVEAYYNLGNALSRIPERLPEAITQYRAALRIQPDLAEAHENLGNALLRMPGELADAIAEYQAAIRIGPNVALRRLNLGNALAQIPDRLPEAIAEYQAAIRIDPSEAIAYFGLAAALSQMPGREKEAIAQCQMALAISPDLVPAQELLQRLRARRD
jgi:tetratricopeptide (TPR) repeat protein